MSKPSPMIRRAITPWHQFGWARCLVALKSLRGGGESVSRPGSTASIVARQSLDEKIRDDLLTTPDIPSGTP